MNFCPPRGKQRGAPAELRKGPTTAAAWLDAFVVGQQLPAAQSQVREFMATRRLGHDRQLKILQAVDELDRTLKIRRKFPD